MKRISGIILLLLFAVPSIAQNKLFTTEDVIINAYINLKPKDFKQISWIDSKHISIVDTLNGTEILYSYDIESGEKSEVLKLNDLKNSYKNISDRQIISFPSIGWVGNDKFSFYADTSFYHFLFKDSSLKVINNYKNTAEGISLSPNRQYIAYTIENNIYVNLKSSSPTQITFDGEYGIVNGKAVHRSEFGINKGIFWSPDSRKIAFYRMDETMVTDYPLVDISTTPAKLENIKYPMAGQISHEVKIGIFDIESKETVWLNVAGPKDQYLTCVTWDPSSAFIYSAILNRDQNHLKLIKFNSDNGEEVKVLFEESNPKYVEPENPLYFVPNSGGDFLWFSERDGWDHLYLFDNDGNLKNQVTKGNWVVTGIDGFSSDGKYVFINATKDSPLESNYYSVNIETGKINKLTTGAGTHSVNSGPGKKYFINEFNSTEIPRQIRVIDNTAKIVATLLNADNPLKDYSQVISKTGVLNNSEGDSLYYNIILPPDFNENKKYPAIVYVYGGPHVQLITNSFAYGKYDIWFRMMAQKGYVIFSLDNRGSSNRGLEFEQATFRNLGKFEIEDQMTGVKYLKSLPFIDSNRLGVYGWSYGGFMATSLMLKTNNTFKVGVAGGAVTDWELYEAMYTERYMDTPQTNFEGYDNANLCNYIKNLKGKLLEVHGTNDPTVVWQNTLRLAEKAAQLNILLDYYPYPGHGHHVTGKDGLHLYNKITEYFLDNL